MATINNVNLDALEQVRRQGQADRSKLKRTQVISGEWLIKEGEPQFHSEISFEGGKTVLESDQPKNLGGGGTRPGPMHYCFYGLLSCYTAVFVATASQMGIKLNKLSARVEGDLNFARMFGLSDEPVMEEIRITLQVESDAPEVKLKEIERLAHERCPAVYALTKGVKLNTALEIKK